MIPMVTSPLDQRKPHPSRRGLVPILLDLGCQFRGDWSQLMAIFTSEYGSNSFIWEEIIVICHFFFQSRIASLRSQECLQCNQAITILKGCVSILFCFWLSVNFISSPDNDYSEWRWPVSNEGVHPCISLVQLLYSVDLLWVAFFAFNCVYSLRAAEVARVPGQY